MMQLDTAITTWNEHDQHIDFAVHLGDIIDGFNPKNTTMVCARDVMKFVIDGVDIAIIVVMSARV